MGGKSKLAATIIARLPAHTTYVEPFCGGCAVFLNKPRSRAEILNDTDNRLVTLLRVMRYHPDALLEEMQYLTHARQEFADALTQPGVTDIHRAARFLMVIKSCFGSRLSSPTFGCTKKEPANFKITDIEKTVQLARERLDGVTIENLDFADVIARYDSSDTLLYCDPPYIGTAGYACKFTMADHVRLRDCLNYAKGRVLVSLNDCDSVRELYFGWDFSEVQVAYTIGRTTDRRKQNREVLISKP